MALSDLNNLDLKDLNLKDLANAPAAAKSLVLGVVFVAIVGAAYYFHLSDQLAALESLEKEEATLRDTYSQKVGEAHNIEIYRQQYKETEQALAAMIKQLPSKAEVDALLTDINQAGLGRGLAFDLFRPGQAAFADFYATLPVSIKVNGSYHQVANFISDIAALSRIVTVHDINIVPSAKPPMLSMDATLKTYRYLDESESAAAKQAAANKGGQK